ncbi:MAG TPA: hypothetical protein VIJ85_13370 [Rhizomicrobium sp.]
MAKTKRQYSIKTTKLLFGSCGNQCAAPNCTNPINIAEMTLSDAAVVVQICHIYAVANSGLRGKPGLTEKGAQRTGQSRSALRTPPSHHRQAAPDISAFRGAIWKFDGKDAQLVWQMSFGFVKRIMLKLNRQALRRRGTT